MDDSQSYLNVGPASLPYIQSAMLSPMYQDLQTPLASSLSQPDPTEATLLADLPN